MRYIASKQISNDNIRIANSLVGSRTLSFDDYSKVLELEEAYLINPAMCLRSSEEDIKKSVSSGVSCGLFDGLDLVAYCLCYYNDYSVGFVEKCFVHPKWRGKGFQLNLLKECIFAMNCVGIVDVYTMVSPGNVWSLNNFKLVGFEEIYKKMFDGHQRLVLRYDSEN